MTDVPEPSMQLLAEAAQNESRNIKDGADNIPDQDDRSSSLSDLEDRPATEGDDRNLEKSSSVSEGGDTEAETERLEDSPHKIRKQKIVHLGITHNLPNGSSPSTAPVEVLEPEQLSGATLTDKFEKGNIDYSSDVPDPTSEISSLEESAAEGSPPDSPASRSSKKRKREEEEEEEEEDTTAKSLKRVAIQLANHVADSASGRGSGSTPVAAASNGGHRVEDAEATDGEAEDSAVEDHGDDDNTVAEPLDNVNNIDSNDEDVDMEDVGPEPDTGPSGRTKEERESLFPLYVAYTEQSAVVKKKAALDMLTKIEKDFALLRDR